MCASPGDVAETLAFARRSGVHVTPRSGGHCLAGRSSTEGIVVDVTPMSSVAVADGVATVGAGTRLEELYAELARYGVTLPAGCGPSVGIAGLTLGGGLGVLGRKHGLTCDRLVAAQIVLADGRVVDCDDRRHADLFWALRGAGGCRFGVVTSLAFATVPMPSVTTFHLAWPAGDAARVIEAWQAWAPDAPDELSASLRLTAAGDPGRAPVVNLFGAMLAGESETRARLDELVGRLATLPEAAALRHHPDYPAAKQALVGLGAAEEEDPDRPGLLFSRSELFRRSLPAEAIAAVVGVLGQGRRRGESRELNLTPLGGAYNRVPAGATAYAHRDERFLVEHVLVADGEPPAARPEWVTRSWATLHPWGSGRVYPNFPEPDLADWSAAYHGDNLERLLRVKRAYDPDGLFRFDPALAAAAGAR
jgi:FAD/FMN-containing dehydrogenase